MHEKPATAEPRKKARRRWYQFSIRTLLIGVMLLGLVCAYVVRILFTLDHMGDPNPWATSKPMPSPDALP
jgi:hypothetical protein